MHRFTKPKTKSFKIIITNLIDTGPSSLRIVLFDGPFLNTKNNSIIMSTVSKIPTLKEVIEMTSKDRYEYFLTIRSNIKVTRLQIAHMTNLSRAMVDHVFSGVSRNEQIIKIILENISHDTN